MMVTQLEIFQMMDQSTTHEGTRHEKQKNKDISYDTGEYIGGSRKDLAALAKRFIEKPSIEIANSLTDINRLEAGKIIKKENFFSWFSMEACHKKGMDILVAYGLNLILRRIPKNAEGLNHEQYTEALIWLSEQFQTVTTYNEFSMMFYRIKTLCFDSFREEYLEHSVQSLKEQYEEAVKENDSKIAKWRLSHIQINEGTLHCIPLIKRLNFRQLKGFVELFTLPKRKRTFDESIQKYGSWKEYFDSQGKKETAPGKRNTTPLWERKLPHSPKREGGPMINDITSPEEFRAYFGFRGLEFGLWVNDQEGLGHLRSSMMALTDLHSILNLSAKDMSLGEQLGFAIGARGKGSSLAHFERSFNVINLTKEKGSLGVLAHEWYHALDRYLYLQYASTDQGGMLTEGELWSDLPFEVYEALNQLMSEIKEGNAVGQIDVSNCKHRYSYNSKFVNSYEECERDLQKFVDQEMEKFDKPRLDMISYYAGTQAKKMQANYEKARKIQLKKVCEAAAQLHREMTGEEVKMVPYTTQYSQYYLTSMAMDKGKKVYWSSNVELTARAFESYVYHELKNRGWRSDYLVCGIDTIYPLGEEAERINKAMEQFLSKTLVYVQNTTQG